ncbi:MAG TPA: DUF721 domain-containing protein [Gaiellaceae bacterium]|nr:DUF721 domain-containing protein [Gaiellaceae bacterium]
MGPLADQVTQELARCGPGAGLTELVDRWPDAVGPDVARNAWPARIARDGTLHVNTASSAWAVELGHLEPRIRASLGKLAPQKIRFAVGPVPGPAAPVHAVFRRPIAPSAEDRARASEIAAGIGDESLRKIVAKAASLGLAQAESDRSF